MLLLFLAVFFLVAAVDASAANCGDYKNESVCTSGGCNWRSDLWGGGWCEQLDCWSFWTQSDCNNAVSTYNLSCKWSTGSAASGWCAMMGCWNYQGTNESACVNESAAFGVSCQWSGTEGQYNCMGGMQCNTRTTRAACINATGCTWGSCFERGCWSYTSSATCNAESNCAWNSNYNSCEIDNCYSSRYRNESSCTNTSDTKVCRWNPNYGGYCEELSCHSFDFNQSACITPAVNGGLDCNWQASTSMCMENTCGSYSSESACQGKVSAGKNCTWQVSKMQNTGWCEKVNCWSFDLWHNSSTNSAGCTDNGYGLSCVWDNSTGGGWCFQNVSALSCSNLTDQKRCWDTMYCFWDDMAKTCNEPSGGFQGGAIGGSGGGGSFKAPSCSVFYLNESSCNSTIGCGYDSSLNGTARCVSNATITANGLNCSMFNTSTLCNSVPFMPYCCEWQAGSCVENKFGKACLDNLATPPDGAKYCEDTSAYNTESKCNQIANSPWYMPCLWNNATGYKRCEFAQDFFGSGKLDDEKGDLDLLDNKMACEKGGGGTWVTESYCGTGNLSNVSISAGRCVSKIGVAGGNCDTSCSNCEFTSSGTNHSSESAARKACEGSNLGFCNWISDGRASNGFGYCKPKKEFQSGAVSKCTSTNCDACNTYQAGKAKDKCIEASCDWAVDPVDPTKGTCITKGGKTCSDDCAACKTQQACSEKGRGGPSSTNNYVNPCAWDSSYGTCKTASGSSTTNSEICFNSIDDDGDLNIDCADNGCFSDPFCGGGAMASCSQYNNNATCTATTGCYWFNDSFGSWCDMKSARCWENDGNQEACNALNESCQWHTPPAGMGAMCSMNESVFDICRAITNSTLCDQNSNCKWFVDSWCSSHPESCGANAGWCGHKYDICTMNTSLNTNMTACEAANSTVGVACRWVMDMFGPGPMGPGSGGSSGGGMTGGGHCEPPCFTLGSSCNTDPLCESKTGFCDPLGFGGGGSQMFNCWQYDNDSVQCNNQTQCSWATEMQPFCDINMQTDCGQFGNNATGCNLNSNCKFFNKTDQSMMGQWCGMKSDDCFQNTSLQGNSTACDASTYCRWSNWNTCEPKMFVSSNDPASCVSSGGNWRTGWCKPTGMVTMFSGMAMDSPPVPLGNDDCSETSLPAYSDICFAGVKDSPDNWGIGISVRDVSSAAMCNGVKTFQGLGSGTGTAKFYWYLDSDGRASGGCTLYSNSSSSGWDVFLQYVGSYSNGTVSETKSTYRCLNNSWVVTNIQLNGWKEKMCNELKGGMVALNKDDITQFEGLLNLSTNIRFYMATANGSTNSTVPLDTLGPVYYTPGTMDFTPECCWALSDANIDCDNDGMSPANDPDCSFIKDKGYIPFEDCWGNNIDEDGDSSVDCNDPDCRGNTYCVQNHLGVEASGYVDTTSPKTLFWQIEKYPDAALLSFDSDEPANGTVFFYKTNSSCTNTTLNATLYDVGIWSNDTPNFKNWHEVEIYNDNGVNSLSYALSANTTYFYKFKVCDQSGNCAQSACGNFTTAQSVADCRKCFFLFNLDLPSNVSLDLDLNNNGSYDSMLHRQCGSSAGFLINYTQARSLNMKFTYNATTPSTQIFLMGVRLMRSLMHNNELRKIDKSGGIKAGTTSTTAGTTVGYAGFDKEITNKLVDKLHPKYCMINMSGTGTCDILYHCDDSLTNCVDKTSTATLNETGSNYCVWKIPCTFSTYAGGNPGSAPGGDNGGGGGGGGSGGGGAAANTTTKQSQLWAAINALETVKMTLTKEAIAFSEITFSAVNALKLASIEVLSLKSKPSGLPDPENAVYQFLEVKKTNIKETDVSSIRLKFKVPVSWTTENNVDAFTISLERYSGDKWVRIPITITASDASKHYFEASLPGLSYFAITGIAKPVENASEKPAENISAAVEPPKEEPKKEEAVVGEQPKEEPKKIYVPVMATVIAVIVILAAYFLVVYRKRER